MAFRVTLCCLLIIGVIPVYVERTRKVIASQTGVAITLTSYIALRVASYIALYIFSPVVFTGSDLVQFYYPEAKSVAQGLLPYRDFPTSYGPLFPILCSLFVRAWDSYGAVAAVTIGFEILSVGTFLWLFGSREGTRQPDVAHLGLALYTYLFNPAAFYWSGIAGYNSGIVAFFWIAGLLLLSRGRGVSGTLVAGLSIMVGKLLGAIALPAFVLDRRVGWRGVATLSVALGAAFAAMYVVGMDALVPLKRESLRSTSGNLWFVASAFLPLQSVPLLWNWGPIVALGSGAALLALRASRVSRGQLTLPRLIGLVSALNLLFLLLSKKTYPHYAPMSLLFVSYVLSRWDIVHRSAIALMAIASAALIFEPGIWNALGQPQFLSISLAGPRHGLAVLLLAVDLGVCSLYAYLLWASAKLSLEG